MRRKPTISPTSDGKVKVSQGGKGFGRLRIFHVPPDTLHFADYNPRRLSVEQYEHLKKSILEEGFVEPVVANAHPSRKNILIGGHQRVRVAKDLKLSTVPVVFVSKTLPEEKRLNLRLNRIAGSWDWDLLANNYGAPDLLAVGFSLHELDLHFNPDLLPPEKKPDLALSKEPKEATCPKCGTTFSIIPSTLDESGH